MIEAYPAQLWVLFDLKPDLTSVGEHHVRLIVDDLPENRVVVRVVHNRRAVNVRLIEICVCPAGICDDTDAGLIDVVQSLILRPVIAADNGLQALPSATNFVTVDCGRDGAFARALLAALADRDVFIRMPGVAPLDRCIRISTAPDAELDVLAAELPGALTAARSRE